MSTPICFQKKNLIASTLVMSLALPCASSATTAPQVLQFPPVIEAASAAIHDDALCGSRFAPATLSAGSKLSATIVMWNSGTTTWKRDEVKLSSPATTWGATAIMSNENTVSPGQKATFVMNALSTPQTAGTYPFEWQMARGGSKFGERCKTTVTLVSGATSSSSSAISSRAAASSSAPGASSLAGTHAINSIVNGNTETNGTVLRDKTRKDIGAFTFGTSCGNTNVTIRSIIFDIQATNMSLDPAQFIIHPLGQMTGGIPCTALTASGNALPASTDTFVVSCKPPNAMIKPCRTLTLALQGYVRNSRLHDELPSKLLVSLSHFNDDQQTMFGADASHLVWTETAPGRSLTHFWLDYPTDLITSTSYSGMAHHVFK